MGFNYREPKPVRSYGVGWNVMPWSFVPNVTATTSNPLAANTVGPISVVRTSTGLYTVTITNGGAPIVLVQHTYEAPIGLQGQFWLQTQNCNDTLGTFQIVAMNVGTTTLVNFTATTGQVVHGLAMLQASSYTR